MTRLPLVSLSLAAITLFAVVPAVQADLVDGVDEVTKFTGTVTDVGVVRGPGQTGGVEYRIHGEFTSPVEVILNNSTFTIDEFFFEPDGAKPGAGELMRASQGPGGPETDPLLKPCGLPTPGDCTLAVSKGDPDDATFETPGRFRPQIKVKVERDEDKLLGFKYKFDVRLDRGMMRTRPLLCAKESDGRTRTSIRISFTITDTNEHSLIVSFTNKWECSQPDRYHMRSR
jgi:hypothetical protein